MRTCAANWLHHQGSCTSCIHTCPSPSSPTTSWARSIKCISPKLRPTLLANIVHNDAVEEDGWVGGCTVHQQCTDRCNICVARILPAHLHAASQHAASLLTAAAAVLAAV